MLIDLPDLNEHREIYTFINVNIALYCQTGGVLQMFMRNSALPDHQISRLSISQVVKCWHFGDLASSTNQPIALVYLDIQV